MKQNWVNRSTAKWLLMFIFLCFACSCRHKTETCLKARVIRISCASFVVQVLNKDSIGDYGWRDVGGHAVYNNVFRVMNSCKIGKLFKGEEFYFTIADSLIKDDCNACRMYDAPPKKTLQIQHVSRNGCETTTR